MESERRQDDPDEVGGVAERLGGSGGDVGGGDPGGGGDVGGLQDLGEGEAEADPKAGGAGPPD